MTKQEIIEETVAYYSKNTARRSVAESGGCAYVSEIGNNCAIGRCMTPRYKERVRAMEANEKIAEEMYEDLGFDSLDSVLKKKYRGHDSLFWARLQQLHDAKENWNDEGITKEGVRNVKRLEEWFK